MVAVLRFNSERLLQDIKNKLNIEFDKISNLLIQYMIGEISLIPHDGSIDAVGKPDWRLDVIEALKFRTVNTAWSIVKEVGILEQADDILMKAMIINYGMGKAADHNNPYLSDYLGSEFYHTERGGMNVYGRQGKEVYDPDTDSWGMSTATHQNEIEHFRQIGSDFWDKAFQKVFGNSVALVNSHINEIAERVMSSIDYSKYIEVVR